MKLDAITARVRLRQGVRATDFGVALARRWWTAYMPAWCLVTLPFFLAGAVFIYFDVMNALLVLLALWWLKPLWDRAILFVLSRSFFGEEMTLPKVLSFTVRSWIRWPALAQITVLRLIPIRGTFDPVLELERPRAGDALKRYSNLLGGFDGHGLFLATTMEWLFLGSAFAVLALVMPETLEYDMTMVTEAAFGEIYSPGLATLVVPLYWVALTFVEPFFVSSGFACYINRRVELEGWDIELTFRRLAERLRHRASDALSNVAALFLALSFAVSFAAPGVAHAQIEQEQTEEYVEYEEEPRGYYDDEGNWVWYDDNSVVEEYDAQSVREIESGHIDDNGQWVTGPGYFNESGEWVDVEGYFDADGNFIEGSLARVANEEGRYAREIEDPQEHVAELLADPVFGKTVVEEVWRPKHQDTNEPEPERPELGSWVQVIAAILEVLAYIIIVAILGGIIYLIAKRFGSFGRDAKTTTSAEATAMILPDGRRIEVPSRWLDLVMPRWNDGDRVMALSLFYRGVLRDLKESHQIKVPDSATSRETVRVVKRAGGPHQLVREIASLWTREVYAGRGPSTVEVNRMVTAYRDYRTAAGGDL